MAIKGTVSLEGIEFFSYHGLYDFEREKGNTFIVDVFMQRQYESDELHSLVATIDYEKVYALVEAVMADPEALLETVAHKMQVAITAAFGNVEKLTLKVKKKNPPIKNAKLSYSAFQLEWEATSVK